MTELSVVAGPGWLDSARNSHHLNFDSPPILLKDNADDNVIILNFMSNNI